MNLEAIKFPGRQRFRFGVNYTPTRHWYYCWNDFEADSIRRDLDTVAELHSDHIRLQLIWPWFQPNPNWVSPAHLERLRTLMSIAAERGLDVCVAALNGWLSGYAFQPPFGGKESIYTSPLFRAAQERYFTELSKVLQPQPNFLGFDLGNEMNYYWPAPVTEGDAWMNWAMDLVERLAPGRVHVNGVDHAPWFWDTTFSPTLLAQRPQVVAIHAWCEFTGALQRGGPLDPPSAGLCAGMTALAKAHAGDAAKPVWIQEFGASPEWMPAEIIPDFLEHSVRHAIGAGATWFTWWCSHDLDRRMQFVPLEYELGLITQDQQIKPQGGRFRQLADEWRKQSPVVPTALDAPPAGEHANENTWNWLKTCLKRHDDKF
jgi:endo-1,4-beta-mannosidase